MAAQAHDAGAFACTASLPLNLGSIDVSARECNVSFRFVPPAYLANCGAVLDRGAEILIYLQSLVEES